ncbi:MAG: MMPL family transporter [Chloroflexota bacterium]
MRQGFFPSLGQAVVRHAWWVVVLWLVLVAVSIPVLPLVVGELKGPETVLPDRESGRASAILEKEFDRTPVRTALAVFTSPTLKVTDPAYREFAIGALDRVSKVKGVNRVVSFYNTVDPRTGQGLARFAGSDERTTYAVVLLSGTADDAVDAVVDVRKALEPEEGNKADVTAYLTGLPSLVHDIQEGSQHDLERAHQISIPIMLTLLVLVLGTIVAAGLPIVLGGVAVIVTLLLIYQLALRTDVSIFAMNTATMLGMGLGIDFSLLMTTRFREELANGLSPHQATVKSVATAGQSIFFSGLTVILGLSVLMIYDLVTIRSIAGSMMLVAAVSVLGAVTLLPALFVIFGTKINALNVIPGSSAAKPSVGRGRWHDLSMAVMRQPWLYLILSLVVLGALAVPSLELYPFGAGGYHGIAKEAESRKGSEILAKAFPAGESLPITVIVSTNRTDGAWDDQVKEGVFRLTQKLQDDERVARVDSIATLNPNMTLEQVKGLSPQAIAQNPSLGQAIGQFVNLDKKSNVQLLTVVPRGDEMATETVDLVNDMRDKIIPDLRNRELKSADVLIAGETSHLIDYHDKLYKPLPLMIALVLLITFVVLLLFFHSLILPLKAILMNVVSIAASYGAMVLVFQHGWLDKPLNFDHLGHVSLFPPVILFTILFGLSTDYEVFLLSRVKELYKKGYSNEASVAEGLERTARLITAAGAMMLGVFGAFALADILIIKEIGVGLAVAVFLDSTIIRIILVPASMKLMGATNWWLPEFLSWVPEISEGEEDEPGPHAARAYSMTVCSACGGRLPTRAQFCGRCGSRLAAPAAPSPNGHAPAAHVAASQGRAAHGPDGRARVYTGYGAPAANSVTMAEGPISAQEPIVSPVRPVTAQPDARPAPAAAGSHMIQVILKLGQQRRRGWVRLRDCDVEMNTTTGETPSIAIDGMQIGPRESGGTPEIQVVNARVKL